MRIGTISAITLCLASFVATRATASLHGGPTTTQRGPGAPHTATTPHAPTAPHVVEHEHHVEHAPQVDHQRHVEHAPHADHEQHGEHGRRGRTPTTTTTTTPTTTTTTRLNPIAAKISSHPQQLARIQRMLPEGMTLNQASQGFRNQGQFIAALHVSQNLHIPFRDLRRAMTGPNAMSLGQAIHTLRPSANSTVEANRANHQTTTDLR